jgi:hypothetical protein
VAKDDDAEVEMTVIHFKTKSNNATLQENVRAIANTLARALAPPPPRVASVPKQITSGNGAEPPLDEQGYEEDALEGELVPPKPARKARSSSGKGRTPEILQELDFTADPMPLKQFIEEKKVPDDYSKRYLAIAYWFRQYRSINEVSADHIYTAYRFMGWGVPKDVSKPLRNLKAANEWLSGGSSRGLYVVNHIGENIINEMGKS